MQYMLAIFTKDPLLTDEEYADTCRAYEQAMRAAGVYVDARGLDSASAAATVRIDAGRRFIEDGPFAPVLAPLGGYVILDVATLHEALDWAVRCPAATRGTIEVRPVLPRPDREDA